MRIINFTTYINESKNYKKYNDILKNLGVIDKGDDIDLNNMIEKINSFLSKDSNKDKFLKDFNKDVKPEVDVEKVEIKVKKLKPSQKDIFLDHVLSRLVVKDYEREQILNGKLKDNDILISEDNYIIDGHHRWTSAFILNPNCELNCTRINLPIKYALPLINAILLSNDINNNDDKKYIINIFKVLKNSKKSLFNKMNSVVNNTIKNGIEVSGEKLKSEESWTENDEFSKSFYKNIKKKLELDKHPLKWMRKNLKKISKPDDEFSNRKDMPQLTEDDAKKLL